jgi:predicted transcriptional regulator
MSMIVDLDAIQVHDAMSPIGFTVSPIQGVDHVAKLFQQHSQFAAPVVDELGKCIGIITSSDLVQYQAQLAEVDSHIDRGMTFETEHRATDGCIELVAHPFSEVQRHMSTCLQTIDRFSSLGLASRIMREQHIHHLIVLDESLRPAGILSSLDILSKLDG